MKERLKKRISRVVDWGVNCFLICFALAVLWLLGQVFFFASFSTPSNSMSPTILPGDYVLVNKFIMGPRLFDIFDALGGKQVRIRRGQHFGQLKSGDVVVFNHPYAESWDSLAMNIRVYYMKRCVAVPGDTVEIRECRYLINGCPVRVGVDSKQQEILDFLDTNADKPELIAASIVLKAFPNDSAVGWTIRNMGPMVVPKKGTVISLDTISAIVYKNYIEWESGCNLTNDATGIRLGDSLITNYEFQKDYCFVAGDNAFNSQDSRYFGLVPIEYVVGKASFIWQSINPITGNRRWDRMFDKMIPDE